MNAVMLTDKENKMITMYEKQLQLNKLNYILLYGVLLWGTSILAMMILVDRFLFNKSLDRQWNDGLLIRIIMVPVAGIFFGWYMRRLSEKRLSKLKEKDQTT